MTDATHGCINGWTGFVNNYDDLYVIEIDTSHSQLSAVDGYQEGTY